MKKLLFFVAEDYYFFSHRIRLAKAAIHAGYQVSLMTRCHQHQSEIEAMGITVYPLKHFTRSGLNPYKQGLSLREIYQILKKVRPDILHQVAMKPILYGSLIGLLFTKAKIINALGGLGFLFTNHQSSLKRILLRTLLTPFFRWIFSRTTLVLQNPDDVKTLKSLHWLPAEQTHIIPGSGIDIYHFLPSPQPPEPPIIIVCMARLLWTKGIKELVEATQLLQSRYAIQVHLYGNPDLENPESIPESQVQSWHQQGILIWQGHTDFPEKAYQACHIAVLPSYREGLPKTLLEAASCAKPIVTTNVPGCREIVIDQDNGILVPPKDPQALAQALVTLIENRTLRETMGERSRKIVENTFSEEIIHQQFLHLYETCNANL